MHFPIWYFSLLVYFVGSTTNSLLQRRLAQTTKVPLRLTTALIYLCFMMPLGVVIALTQRNFWIVWKPMTFLLLTLETLGIGTFFAYAFQINKKIDATQYVVINNMYTIVTVLIGVFLLHEAFSGVQFIGALLLIIGGILVAIRGFTKATLRPDRFSLLMFVLSMGIGVGLAAERGCLNYMSFSVYVLLGWGLQTAFISLFALKEWAYITKINKAEWRSIQKIGVARALHNGGFFMSVALSRNVSLIASISSFRIPLVFIASFIFIGERDHLLRRFIGVSIATIGLLLI